MKPTRHDYLCLGLFSVLVFVENGLDVGHIQRRGAVEQAVEEVGEDARAGCEVGEVVL